jgi:hypothetical protein
MADHKQMMIRRPTYQTVDVGPDPLVLVNRIIQNSALFSPITVVLNWPAIFISQR